MDCGHQDPAAPARPVPRPRNDSWAERMQRVFAIDVLECPSCGGRMRILAAIHGLGVIRAILECVGLPARPPPVSPPDPEDPEAPDLFEAYPRRSSNRLPPTQHGSAPTSATCATTPTSAVARVCLAGRPDSVPCCGRR